jgi:putative oxidoreductase
MQNRALLFGPLPIRIMFGIGLIAHGYPKITDLSGPAGFLADMGLPTELAAPIAVLEFVGGIVLMLGILTRITSGLIIAEMIANTFVIKLSKGFVGGFELDLLYLAAAVSLLIMGPGRASIEWDVIKREIIPRGKELVASR